MGKPLPGPSCPAWMMTFGDCMSLLLTFFVMLMTFSTLNANKLMDIIGGIQGAMGVKPPKKVPGKDFAIFPETKEPKKDGLLQSDIVQPDGVDKKKMSPVLLRSKTIIQRFNKLLRTITKAGFKNVVFARQLDEGILISIDAKHLFKGDTDALAEDAFLYLQGVANLAADIGNEVRLSCEYRGDGPAGQDYFFSPSYLAIRRAEAVGDFLSKEYKIDTSRLGFSVELVPEGRPEAFHVLLVEKLGISEVGLKDVMSVGQGG